MIRIATVGLVIGAVASVGCAPPEVRRHSLESGIQGWQTLAPLAAGPRQETAVVAVGGLVYVLGGFTETLTIVPRVEVYNPKSDTWLEVATLPQPLHHANAAAVGDRLYVLGALIQRSFTAIGDSYVYDPKANSWSQVTSMPMGTERGAGGTFAIGTKVYVAGGYRNGSVPDFSAYDTSTDTWENLPSLDEPRDHLVAGSVAAKFYAVGGRRNGELRGNVDEFDPAAGKWTAKAPMLTPRAGTAGAVLADRILVAGGEGNPEDPKGIFAENEGYDPAGDTWTTLAPMLTPRHGTGGASIEGVFFVPGGATRQGFGAVATNESYR